MNDPIDRSELLRQARAIKSEAEATARRAEDRHQLYLTELAGELADRAMKDRGEAEKCLCHPDKNVRIVGLTVMLDVWQANDDTFRAACERLLLHDPDEQVRAVAINCLSKCHEATNDQRIASMLATLVRNESFSTEVRTAAYFGLLTVTGEFGHRPELILDFAFPEDVDWSYVDRVR